MTLNSEPTAPHDQLEASLGQPTATRRRLLAALLLEALNPAAGGLEAAE